MQCTMLTVSRLWVLLLLPLLLGCDTTGGPTWDNLAPQSQIVEPSEPSGSLTVADGTPITFKWRCVDPEEQLGLPGGLSAIEIQLDGGDAMLFECPPDEGEWWFSSSAESGSAHRITSINLPSGGNRSHTFTVRAQDITGCWEAQAEAAIYTFRYNHPPSSEILSPQPGETVGSSFTVTWAGADVDGDVVEYEYALDPGQAAWEITEATSRSYTDVPSGGHEFWLRAKDGSDCWQEGFGTVSFHVD